MRELQHALNSAGTLALRELADWFRRQAATCDTLASLADANARASIDRAAWIAHCRAGRYADAERAGAPADMVASWRALNGQRGRRQQLEQRRADIRALLAAEVPQRRIARAVGLSLGRVNQLAAELRRDGTTRLPAGDDRP